MEPHSGGLKTVCVSTALERWGPIARSTTELPLTAEDPLTGNTHPLHPQQQARLFAEPSSSSLLPFQSSGLLRAWTLQLCVDEIRHSSLRLVHIPPGSASFTQRMCQLHSWMGKQMLSGLKWDSWRKIVRTEGRGTARQGSGSSVMMSHKTL